MRPALIDDLLEESMPMTVSFAQGLDIRAQTLKLPFCGLVVDYSAEVFDPARQRVATGRLLPIARPEQVTAGAEETTAYRVARTDYLPKATPLARSELVAEWHGQVTKVLDESFVAELRGVSGKNVGGSLEEAEIPLGEVRDDDLALVRVGAFFRLCVSYEKSTTGTRRRYAEVIFRRLPAYRREELEEAAAEAEQILRDIRVE